MQRTARARKTNFSVAHAARVLGVSPETMARILRERTATVLGWIKGVAPTPKPELAKLRHVVEMLEFTFCARDSIRAFLRHPNPGLNGQVPLALLKCGQFDLVAAGLLAICEGVYV